MDEIFNIIEKRSSTRDFKHDMLKDEEIEKVVKAGTYAANGMGKQSPIIIVIKDKSLRDKISEENRKIGGWKEGFDPFYNAPVILVVLADKNIPTYLYDGSLVLGNMMLAAEALCLGNIWIHRAKEEFESEFGKGILDKLGIKGNYEGIGHLALGYKKEAIKKVKTIKENYIYYIK